MATYTTNMHLTKPDVTDTISPTPFNDNFDAIDSAFGNLPVTFVSNEITKTISSGATSTTLLTDSRITSASLVDVYFTSDTIAYAETLKNLKVSSNTGSVTASFSSASSSGTIKYRIHVRVV